MDDKVTYFSLEKTVVIKSSSFITGTQSSIVSQSDFCKVDITAVRGVLISFNLCSIM
jgi:hypothetical protein